MPCPALRNVPKKKLEIELEKLSSKYEEDKAVVLKKAMHRYFEANIPVLYWSLEMIKHFTGEGSALNYYKKYTEDITSLYKNGLMVCFAGSHGSGKTFLSTNILKRALEKGFSGLYVSLSDIVSASTSVDKFSARRELLNTDFLVIDEFDPRYMGSSNASDFYGRTLEDVLRSRSQNKLPLIMCSNSPNPEKSFGGDLERSIGSLWNHVELIPIIGTDYRKNK